MSSILTRNRGAERASSKDGGDGGARQQLLRAVEIAMEDAETERSSGRDAVRTFLLVDLGAALGYLLGNRDASSEVVESVADRSFESQSGGGGGGRRSSDGSGRSTLTTLFLLGVVVGVGYMLRTRMGSADEIATEATDRARRMADDTAMRSGEAAGRTETVTEEAADRIEETGAMAADRVETGSEEVADRIREGGEGAADQIEEAGETVENVEGEAEERAEEMTDAGGESEADEESEQ